MIMKKLGVLLACLLGLLTVSVQVQATTPSTGNGVKPNTGTSPSSQPGYAPPNISESNQREARDKQDKQETKEKVETSIEDDKDYKKAKKASEILDATLKIENPTMDDVKKMDANFAIVDKFIKDNEEKYGEHNLSQFIALKESVNAYVATSQNVRDRAKSIASAQKAMEKAKTSTDISDLSKLTSYMYVEDGWFSTDDVFPKIVNSLVQGLFFLVKAIYILTIIILSKIFSTVVYDQLDQVVELSAKIFDSVMTHFSIYIFMMVFIMMAAHFIRYGKFSIKAFRFLLIWFLAMVLYSKSMSIPFFGESYKADYNLSKLIKVVDTFGSELTSRAITSFDELDNDGLTVNDASEDAMTRVRNSIFDSMVYQPFLALNFSDTSGISEEDVTKLFETGGDSKEVQQRAEEEFKGRHQLSFESVGAKFIVAIAAVFKALIVGVALILLGIMSLAFKYMTLILLSFFVFFLLIAMIPSFEQVLGNVGKKIVQFTLIGALGLVFVEGFLFIDAIIGGTAKSISDAYYWSAIIHGLIWFVLWKFRSLLGGLFVRGAISAMDVKDRAQDTLSSVFDKPFPIKKWRLPHRDHSFLPFDDLGAVGDDGQVRPDLSVRSRASWFRTLTRAGRNSLIRGYDRLRYGRDEEAKDFAQHERADFKQRLKDGAEGTKDTLFSALRFERARAGLHDLAGHTDTPVQVDYEARKNRQLEREERKNHRVQIERDWDKFRQSDEGQNLFRQRQEGNLFPKSERQIEREMKTDFKKQRFMNNKVTPLFDGEPSTETEHNTKSELFNR